MATVSAAKYQKDVDHLQEAYDDVYNRLAELTAQREGEKRETEQNLRGLQGDKFNLKSTSDKLQEQVTLLEKQLGEATEKAAEEKSRYEDELNAAKQKANNAQKELTNPVGGLADSDHALPDSKQDKEFTKLRTQFRAKSKKLDELQAQYDNVVINTQLVIELMNKLGPVLEKDGVEASNENVLQHILHMQEMTEKQKSLPRNASSTSLHSDMSTTSLHSVNNSKSKRHVSIGEELQGLDSEDEMHDDDALQTSMPDLKEIEVAFEELESQRCGYADKLAKLHEKVKMLQDNANSSTEMSSQANALLSKVSDMLASTHQAESLVNENETLKQRIQELEAIDAELLGLADADGDYDDEMDTSGGGYAHTHAHNNPRLATEEFVEVCQQNDQYAQQIENYGIDMEVLKSQVNYLTEQNQDLLNNQIDQETAKDMSLEQQLLKTYEDDLTEKGIEIESLKAKVRELQQQRPQDQALDQTQQHSPADSHQAADPGQALQAEPFVAELKNEVRHWNLKYTMLQQRGSEEQRRLIAHVKSNAAEEHMEATAQLQDKIHELNMKNASLMEVHGIQRQAMIQEYESQIESLKSTHGDPAIQATVDNLRKQNRELQKHAMNTKAAQQTANELKEQNEELQKKLEDRAQLQSTLNELHQRNEELQGHMADGQASGSVDLQAAESAFASLREQNEELQKHVASHGEMQATVATLTQQNEQLQKQVLGVGELQSTILLLNQQNEELQKRGTGHQELQAAFTALQEQNHQLHQQWERDRQHAESAYAAVNHENGELQKQMVDQNALQNTLATLKQQNEEMQKRSLDQVELESTVSTLKQQNQDLRQGLEALEAEQSKPAEKSKTATPKKVETATPKKNYQHEYEIKSRQKTIDELKKQFQDAQKKIKEIEIANAQKINNLRGELTQAKTILNNRNWQAQRFVEMEKKAVEAEQKLEMHQRQSEEATVLHHHQMSEKNQAHVDLKSKNDNLLAQVADLRNKVQNAEAQLAQPKQEGDDSPAQDNLKELNNKLVKQVTELRQKVQESESRGAKAKTEATETKSEAAQSKEESDQDDTQAQLTELKAMNHKLIKQVADLRQKSRKAPTQTKSEANAKEAKAQLEQEVIELRFKLVDAETCLKEKDEVNHTKEIAQRDKELAGLKQKLKQAEARNKETGNGTEASAQRDKEVAGLKQKLKEAEARSNDHGNAAETIAQRDKEVAGLTQQLKDVEARYKEAQEKLEADLAHAHELDSKSKEDQTRLENELRARLVEAERKLQDSEVQHEQDKQGQVKLVEAEQKLQELEARHVVENNDRIWKSDELEKLIAQRNEEVSKMRRSIDALEESNAKYKRSIAESTANGKELSLKLSNVEQKLSTQLAQHEKDDARRLRLENLLQESSRARDDGIERAQNLRKQMVALERDKRALENKQEKLEVDIIRLESDKRDLKHQGELRAGDLSRLGKHVNDLYREIEDARLSNQALNKKVNELNDRIDLSPKEDKRLSNRLAKELEASKGQVRKLDAKKTSLQSEITKMKFPLVTKPDGRVVRMRAPATPIEKMSEIIDYVPWWVKIILMLVFLFFIGSAYAALKERYLWMAANDLTRTRIGYLQGYRNYSETPGFFGYVSDAMDFPKSLFF